MQAQFSPKSSPRKAGKSLSIPAAKALPAAVQAQGTQLEGMMLYEALVANQIPVANIPVSGLFALASSLAVSGRMDLRNAVLSKFVASHPKATPADKQRVEINAADWLRRQGKPDMGISQLKALRLSKEPAVQVEYLQALNQCLLQNAKSASTPDEQKALLRQAIKNQGKLCDIVLSSDEFPADKKIYYLVGLCEHRGHMMLAEGKSFDPEIEKAHELCDTITRKGPVNPAFRKRLAWELPFNKGVYYLDCKKFLVAQEHLWKAWEALRHVPDNRARAAVAVSYLYCVLQPSSAPEISGPFQHLQAFYVNRGQHAFTRGDVPAYKERIDFVAEALGL